jgi:hypothetical protein
VYISRIKYQVNAINVSVSSPWKRAHNGFVSDHLLSIKSFPYCEEASTERPGKVTAIPASLREYFLAEED